MTKITWSIAAAMFWAAGQGAMGEDPMTQAHVISLAGTWQFAPDPDGAGVRETWFTRDLEDAILLPGTMAENGKGNPSGERRTGRLSLRFRYEGPAWYQRDVHIPEGWSGKHVTLFMERCNTLTRVWVDGNAVGKHQSLSAPHVYDLNRHMTPGAHRLTVMVDNTRRIQLGGTQALADDAQSNWNGVIGRIELRATDPVWVERIDVYPDFEAGTARCAVELGNDTGSDCSGTLRLTASLEGRPEATARVPALVETGGSFIDVTVVFTEGFKPWDTLSPTLYTLAAEIEGGGYASSLHQRFGMREFAAEGTQFRLNGDVVFLRGTVDGCIFPLVGHPEMRKTEWLRIMQTCKDHGLNHIRFHSHCPAEAAFAAADELGLIVQAENTFWYDPTFAGGSTGASAAQHAFLTNELDAILRWYGNHPSFALYSMGNELGSKADPFQMSLVHRGMEKDPRRLYTRNSGYLTEDVPMDYYVASSTSHGPLRAQDRFVATVPNTIDDFMAGNDAVKRPVLTHEMGEWNMMPNPDEARKYAGVFGGDYIDIYRALLEKAGMLHQAEAFRRASGALMLSLYKEEIELQLRTPGRAGFQMLGLQDYPAMGVALIGVLDAFYESKGLIVPEAFRRFCGPAVPLLRMPKYVWTSDETLNAAVQVCNYTKEDLRDARVEWRLYNVDGCELHKKTFAPMAIAKGRLVDIGRMELPLSTFSTPAKYLVELRVAGTALRNEWPVWVFPAEKSRPEVPKGVVVARSWEEAEPELEAGRRVLLLPDLGKLFYSIDGTYPTPMWSHAFYLGQAGTMGILTDPKHPAFNGFPTDEHTTWHWWDLLMHSAALMLDAAPLELKPIVQVIDNWDRNHRLGTIFETEAGLGRLLVCTIDLSSDLEKRPAARQLYASLLQYLASEAFRPNVAMAPDQVKELLRPAPVYAGEDQPRPREKAVLHVRPAASLNHTPYPLGAALTGSATSFDESVVQTEGFGYTLKNVFLTASERLGIKGWRNRWWNYPLEIEVTCPEGFAGVLHLRILDWDQKPGVDRVTVGGKDATAPPLGKSNGVWVTASVLADDAEDGKVRITVAPHGGFVWVSELMLMR